MAQFNWTVLFCWCDLSAEREERMIYVFIGLAFCIGVMTGLLLYAGFVEGYFFPSSGRRFWHTLLDQHLSSIADDKQKLQSNKKAPQFLRRR